MSRNVKELEEKIGYNFKDSHLLRHKIKLEKLQGIKDKKIFLEFHTITVVTGLKYWLTSRDIHLSADEAMEYYLFLMSHPILELLEK